MQSKDDLPLLHARSLDEWRQWLDQHGETARGVWLIIDRTGGVVPSVRWHDAIEHALCYGWVDSRAQKRDAESTLLKFTPRNPDSRWGPKNKERALRLTAEGFMTPRGQALIDLAKATGRWDE